jgi:hypothetical protein
VGGYVEYVSEPGAQRRNVAEVLGYVEYTGNAAGSYTSDIATVAEVLGYVEYEYTRPVPVLALIYGPLVWVS